MSSHSKSRPGSSPTSVSVLDAVRRQIQRQSLLPEGSRVLVAVSGGLDSMVLLDVLHRLAPSHGWKLAVAHYNHQLRGRSSDLDEAMVRKTAGSLGIEVFVGRGDVKGFARQHRCSIEMAARKLRHEFLAQSAQGSASNCVATGHHAGDQSELFFIRLLRGAGASGIGGMAEAGPSFVDASICIVRPLLSLDRRLLEDYAAAESIRYRNDSTNFSTDILRNRIRRKLLPLLKREYQPAAETTISRLMEIARGEGEFVTQAAAEWLKLRKPPFVRLHVAVQRRCICQQLANMGIDPDFELIERLRSRPGKCVSISGTPVRHVIRYDSGEVRFEVEKKSVAEGGLEVSLDKTVGSADYDGMAVGWALRAGKRLGTKRPCIEFFDADSIGASFRLRHWQPGDRFQPIGMPRPVKLQNLFTNAKVPRAARSALIVAEDAFGRIFWVENLRISEQHKVLGATSRMLRWDWKRRKPILAGGYV